MLGLGSVKFLRLTHALLAPLLALGMAAISCCGAVADEGRYRLGIQDRLKIHVYEWPALTGEFTVGPDGDVSLPLIGHVPALGADITQLSDTISTRLKAKADLAERPDVAVDILQYRPFYVLGRVERAGEYSYRPGIVVLHAVSIAGGLYRRPEVTDWGAERDAITGASEAELNLLKVRELTARLVRLQAEADGSDDMPADAGQASDAKSLEAERRIFHGRKQQVETSLGLLTSRIALFREEIKALEAGAAAEVRERGVILRELNDTKELVARALAPAPRVIPLERGLAQIDREIKENEAQTLRARQQINIAEQLIADLKDVRKTGALHEIKATHSLIDEARERYRMSRNLVRESQSLALEERPDEAEGEALSSMSFTITRTTNGETRTSEALETTPVLPGDIVNVVRRQDDAGARVSERRRGRAVAEAGSHGAPGATP